MRGAPGVEALRVSYRLDVPEALAAERAEAIALEQTVEVPRVVVRDRFVAEHVVGRVASLSPDEGGRMRAVIDYPLDALVPGDPAQLLGVIFGMTSLQPDAECVDVELPGALLDALRGPRFGLEGLRKLLRVERRPLTCTAIKPLGQSPQALASLLATFARAGIDVVKDDQGLGDHAFCPFAERVSACLRAVARVADETGHEALYVPNLMGTPSRVFEQLRIARELGARAVMVAPLLLGLPTFFELVERAALPVLAHPSFGGARRFAPELLFGTLLRLHGADAVIFVGYAGRFGTPRAACHSLVERLRRPWGSLLPSLPVPGGGVQLESVPELLDFYGPDTMLLCGGSLQLEEGAVLERSRAFVQSVREHAPA